MNSLGALMAPWLARGWIMLLAFTAAVLLVGLLRRPCRRWFGAERAFQLWLLPPLAVLASQCPHAATSVGSLPAMVYTITSVGGALSSHADTSANTAWHTWGMLVWLAGVLFTLALTVFAQWRYHAHLGDAVPVNGVPLRWPVWRATSTEVGPALVGAWHPRIVVPADFEQRYDVTERSLILAHESAHARRGDGWWSLAARIAAALCWFHPLAWLALHALRQDMELACDAAVMREHAGRRRAYANAMLKTQSAALALPVGCSWLPHHPLAERIVMLKLPSPSRRRRAAGTITGTALALVVAGSVYAASVPATSGQVSPADGQTYQLDMKLESATGDVHHRHAERTSLALCAPAGKAASASFPDWKIDAITEPSGSQSVRIRLVMTGDDHAPFARREMHVRLGKSARVTGTGTEGKRTYVIDVTPLAGCPARAAGHVVSEHLSKIPARRAAQTIASKTGFKLVNPQALDNALVSFNFATIPGDRALRLIAEVDGKKAVFDGWKVRFEPQ